MYAVNVAAAVVSMFRRISASLRVQGPDLVAAATQRHCNTAGNAGRKGNQGQITALVFASMGTIGQQDNRTIGTTERGFP